MSGVANFCRDVSPDLQDDVLQRIAEAAWGDATDGVSIIDTERHNMTKHVATSPFQAAALVGEPQASDAFSPGAPARGRNL